MMNTKQFKKGLVFSSIIALMTGLTSCGGGGGGGDDSSSSKVQLSGAVVDDYIGFSKVYIDVNNNDEHDASFEPYAFTDQDGYFSKSKDGTDYCSNPHEYEFRYCLEADRAYKNGGVLKVTQGRDLLTTQIFNLTMSLLTTGETDDLKITSISTLVSEIDNLSVDDLPAGVTDTDELKSNIQNFLNTYLEGSANPPSSNSLLASAKADGDVDPNNVDPFDPAVSNINRGFKLAVQLSKVAEAIALAFENENPVLGKDAEYYTPYVYRAILVNLDFTSNGGLVDPFNTLTTKLDDVLNKVQSLSGANNKPGTSNLIAINQSLNCLLRPVEDKDASITTDVGFTYCNQNLSGKGGNNDNNYPASGPDRLKFLKKQLYASELTAKSVLQTSTEFDNTLTVAVTNLGQRDSSSFKLKNRDFEMTQNEAKANRTADSKTVDFRDVLGADFEFPGHNLELGTSGDDVRFRIYFTDSSNFVGCQLDTDSVNYISGSYTEDKDRPYLLYLKLFGLTYTVKNVEAADHIYDSKGGTPCKTPQNRSCTAMSYFDLGTQTDKTDFFGNAAPLDQLFKDTTSTPQNKADCEALFN